jgi:hypothetical protein
VVGKTTGKSKRTPDETNKGNDGRATKGDVSKSVAQGDEEGAAPRDFVEVREEIAKLVRGSAGEIARAFVAVAKKGQVAPAKYLFEAVGLYPAKAEATEWKKEESLAYRLLKALDLPTEPVNSEEDAEGDSHPEAVAEIIHDNRASDGKSRRQFPAWVKGMP